MTDDPTGKTATDTALERVKAVAERVREAGGRALLVGGAARDRVLGRASRDLDLEIFGLSAGELRKLLSEFGRTREVGRSFPTFLVQDWPIDFALPTASATAQDASDDFRSAYEAAARRRDLTVNAIAIDPLSGDQLDPLGGLRDIEAGVLREADALHFADDALRGVRVARFIAAFGMRPAPSLLRLCEALDLSALPAERMFGELRRILLETPRPSQAFAFLHECGLLRFLPELEALVGVPQDARWHPEGDVFTHTGMVIDAAVELCDGGDDDEALMWGALCHDLGKPHVTTTEADGRVRAIAHSQAGIEPTHRLLENLRAPRVLTERVSLLVAHHLAPLEFGRGNAGARAYRRLALRLAAGGVSLGLLARVARADALGRTTPDALAKRVPDCDVFEARAAEFGLALQAEPDVVLGRDLLARGVAPGPELGRLLERCREVQYERGWRDATRILDAVLADPAVTRSVTALDPAPGRAEASDRAQAPRAPAGKRPGGASDAASGLSGSEESGASSDGSRSSNRSGNDESGDPG